MLGGSGCKAKTVTQSDSRISFGCVLVANKNNSRSDSYPFSGFRALFPPTHPMRYCVRVFDRQLQPTQRRSGYDHGAFER